MVVLMPHEKKTSLVFLIRERFFHESRRDVRLKHGVPFYFKHGGFSAVLHTGQFSSFRSLAFPRFCDDSK